MDVLMPGENGMEAAKEIRRYDTAVRIIFLTSSQEFAVDSYKVGAFFYQLKPILEESLFRLLDSAIAECARSSDAGLIVRCKNGVTRVDLARLEYCGVIGRELMLHLSDGSVLKASGSMDKLCAQLEEKGGFLRIHRSYLVNMERIKTVAPKCVAMAGGAELPIPRGKFGEIKDRYLEYAFQRKQVFLS